MDDTHNDSGLPLPDLYIENFRGIKKLSIPRLGRVNLLAGRNGVGKSTVLDAIRVYAARGREQVMAQILTRSEEYIELRDQDATNAVEVDWTAIFYGRGVPELLYMSIGPMEKTDQLRIESTLLELGSADPDQMSSTFSALISGDRIKSLEASFGGQSYNLVYGPSAAKIITGQELPPPLKFEFLGPGLIPHSDLARMWDDVALTDDEELITKSIELVYGEGIDRVAMVGGHPIGGLGAGRRALVKLKNGTGPVPLRSLGEGASRLFGVALSLAKSRNGFLLIDEAENGIHHTAQQDYWRMVLQTAHENNVQVFATTHSWDCVRGFAQAAVENENVEGVLVRLEKEEKGLRAVRYSEQKLKIAAEQRIEVR